MTSYYYMWIITGSKSTFFLQTLFTTKRYNNSKNVCFFLNGTLSFQNASTNEYNIWFFFVSRLNSVRSLTLSCQRTARSKTPNDNTEVNNEPIKFSTSKASHRVWKVDRTMGSQFKRRGFNVLPFSVLGIVFLLWCALRGETNIDGQLEKRLYEHLPGLLPEEEEEQAEDKPS